jgi:hypothetical protein
VTVCNYCTRVLYATIDTVDVHTLARNEGFNWQVSIALAVDSEVFLQRFSSGIHPNANLKARASNRASVFLKAGLNDEPEPHDVNLKQVE